jgi:hypothetical protein
VPRQGAAAGQDHQNPKGKRRVAKKPRQRQPAKLAELRFRQGKMPLEFVRKIAGRHRRLISLGPKQPAQAPIAAKGTLGAMFETLKELLVSLPFRRGGGVGRIDRRRVRCQLLLGDVISHLEFAHPPPFRFPRQVRKIAKNRGLDARDPDAAGMMNRLEPSLLRLETLLEPGDVRGIAGLRALGRILAGLARLKATGLELAGELVLPLREFRPRFLQGGENLEASVDPQIDTATHSRS